MTLGIHFDDEAVPAEYAAVVENQLGGAFGMNPEDT